VWGFDGCEGPQERYLYSGAKFTPTRATAFAEWRQLLSA
jgi:hypothetical protein